MSIVSPSTTRSTSHASSSAHGGGSGAVEAAAAPAGITPIALAAAIRFQCTLREYVSPGGAASGDQAAVGLTQLSAWAYVACGAAAVGAGAVNTMAGGGTLISFPVMTACGVPGVRANATNTVALCPGYVGGAYTQRRELEPTPGSCGRSW